MLLGGKVFVRYRKTGWAIAFALVVIVAHTAFKQVFGISDLPRFIEFGLAERTTWQLLLALLAIGVAALPQRVTEKLSAVRCIAIVALAHFAAFTLLLHNPLWTDQAVGSWPLANLLLPAYGIAIALVLWLRQGLSGNWLRMRPAFDAAVMVLIGLLALSELRQVFAGTILLDPPVGQQEDLLRSFLAIAVALGFLGWGVWIRQRSWRIGSLVLMLGAVLKVFFFERRRTRRAGAHRLLLRAGHLPHRDWLVLYPTVGPRWGQGYFQGSLLAVSCIVTVGLQRRRLALADEWPVSLKSHVCSWPRLEVCRMADNGARCCRSAIDSSGVGPERTIPEQPLNIQRRADASLAPVRACATAAISRTIFDEYLTKCRPVPLSH